MKPPKQSPRQSYCNSITAFVSLRWHAVAQICPGGRNGSINQAVPPRRNQGTTLLRGKEGCIRWQCLNVWESSGQSNAFVYQQPSFPSVRFRLRGFIASHIRHGIAPLLPPHLQHSQHNAPTTTPQANRAASTLLVPARPLVHLRRSSPLHSPPSHHHPLVVGERERFAFDL